MAPVPGLMSTRAAGDPLAENLTRSQVIGESWAQGFNIGSVVILLLFVLCNYRKGVVLHKLILLEVRYHTSLNAMALRTLADLRDNSSSWPDGTAYSSFLTTLPMDGTFVSDIMG